MLYCTCMYSIVVVLFFIKKLLLLLNYNKYINFLYTYIQ